MNEELFARTPSTLLELFVVLQQNPDVKGVRASTIRAVNKNLWLIDEEFRQNPRNHRLFLEILRAPAGVTHELRRMNTYGVLGRYIPAFGRIVRIRARARGGCVRVPPVSTLSPMPLYLVRHGKAGSRVELARRGRGATAEQDGPVAVEPAGEVACKGARRAGAVD